MPPDLGKPGSVYNTNSWKRGAFRQAVLAQTGGCCAKCGARGRTASPKGETVLTLAHKIPERVRLALRRPLAPQDCVPLCRKCHGKLDGGRRYR